MNASIPALILTVALSAMPVLANAQVVRSCDTFEANARNLTALPDGSPAVRQFANGDVRVIGLDTTEPACCSAHLMVNYFTASEPFAICALVSAQDGLGFSGILFEQMAAQYDPAAGLILTVPAGRYDGSASILSPLSVTINRAAATVTALHR